jgi:hypothetical protein
MLHFASLRYLSLSTLLAAALLAQVGVAEASGAVYPKPPRGTVRVGFFYQIDPTCASFGAPSIAVVSGPSNGQIETRAIRDYPNFPSFNIRFRCDLRKVPGTEVLYRSTPGFRGVDTVVFDVVFPRGQLKRYTQRIFSR